MKKFIDLFSIKIFNLIYAFQEKKHKKRMQKLNDKILSGKVCNEKHVTINGATLSIKTQESEKEKLHQQKVENLIEKHINNPNKLFDYIKGAKTPIYEIKNAKSILDKIGELEGFILPKKGIKALYLNLILNKKIGFKTSEMFVMSSYNVNLYAFLYQFYNWYCYKTKLSGYEDDIQEQFKHVFEICETSKIDELSYEEILNLKSAIKRDIEAIDFVKKITQKITLSKKNLNKIKQGGTISV